MKIQEFTIVCKNCGEHEATGIHVWEDAVQIVCYNCDIEEDVQ